jgi:hypothetical protein
MATRVTTRTHRLQVWRVLAKLFGECQQIYSRKNLIFDILTKLYLLEYLLFWHTHQTLLAGVPIILTYLPNSTCASTYFWHTVLTKLYLLEYLLFWHTCQTLLVQVPIFDILAKLYLLEYLSIWHTYQTLLVQIPIFDILAKLNLLESQPQHAHASATTCTRKISVWVVRMRDSYKRFVKTWIRFANPWIWFIS